jgi:MarR family transcriptional regulator, organic hydroperoxide resistance regulator
MKNPTTQDDAIAGTMQSLRRITKGIKDYYQKVSNQFGVTGPQLWAMKILSRGDGLSIGDLSKRTYLNASTISGVVDRLETKGLVTRDRSRDDRRVVRVLLTDSGRALTDKAPDPAGGRMVRGLRQLEEQELEEISRSLRKLVEIMGFEHLNVTFFFDED